MNTLEELKALHQSIGRLVEKLDGDAVHSKLMSLIGRCYVTQTHAETVAERIIRVEVNQTWRNETTVIIYKEGVRCGGSDGDVSASIYSYPMHLSVQEALREADRIANDTDIIKEAQFEHIKCVLAANMETMWENIRENASV